MKNLLTTFVFFFCIMFNSGAAAQSMTVEKKDGDMEIFAPFIGSWFAPDSIVQKNEQLKGQGIFKFSYDKKHSYINILEHFSINDDRDHAFSAMLSHNPLTGKFEFLGVNSDLNFLFKGYFSNVTPTGFLREYDVYYPHDHEMAKSFGQIISFREEFVLKDKNTLVFDINYFNRRNKKWEPWSKDKYILLRRN